jgi:MOSC domain-containing protein
MPHIAGLYRYPVKGLSADPLDRVTIEAGQMLPFDRAWAIANGDSGFDPDHPRHLPKIVFLMLMRHERLASLATRFDEASRVLTISRDGEMLAEGHLDSDEGRRAVEAFFDGFCADDLRGPAKIVSAPGHAFSDSPDKVVSLINLETVRAFDTGIGSHVHPMRFRGNVHVDGLPAWQEFEWVGRTIRAGGVTFEAVARIDRCAATDVNPETAERDLTVPRSLLEAYGHADCGVYLKVVEGGEIAVGQPIAPA